MSKIKDEWFDVLCMKILKKIMYNSVTLWFKETEDKLFSKMCDKRHRKEYELMSPEEKKRHNALAEESRRVLLNFVESQYNYIKPIIDKTTVTFQDYTDFRKRREETGERYTESGAQTV